MPKLITTKLLLEGEEFLPANRYSATVEMAVGGHSAFTVSFPANATEGYAGPLMDGAMDMIGKRMTLLAGDGLEFTGLVASVDLARGAGASGTITVSGFGPCGLLEGRIGCESHGEGLSLSYVAGRILDGHRGRTVRPEMGEGADLALPYTVQYNESDMAFLRRLCRRAGLWLYHDGQAFRVGRGGTSRIEGTYGSDVTAFGLSTALVPKAPAVTGHDWANDGFLSTPAGAFAPSSSHDYFGTVAERSGQVHRKPGSYHDEAGMHEVFGQRGMDASARVGALAGATGMVTATGTSEIVRLGVGDTLALKGIGFADGGKRDTLGTYDIIRVVHRFDRGGRYANGFSAVPEGSAHPPGSDGYAVPFAPDQRGLVTDNADPMGLGRVRVQLPWQREASQSTPWIKLSVPYAGAGKGMYFVPENGEEVLVGFAGGNPERPYVIGAAYNASQTSGMANADNNIKAIVTRSGHTIELNDTDGGESITIRDKNENLFRIDTASNDISIFSKNDVNVNSENNITVTAKESLMFKAKNIKIGAEENISLFSGKDFTNSVGENHNTMSKNQNIIVEENSMIDAKVQETIADEITLDSKQKNLTLASGKTVDIQSNEKVKLF